MINAIILAAGYGTRLESDILKDTSGEFSHLRGVPKPLIPIAGKPLLDYWIDDLHKCSRLISNIYIVTNGHFYSQFKAWAENTGFPLDNIVNDGSKKNEERLGAVKDIELVIKEKNINTDVLVIAGDTLFLKDFDLHHFLSHWQRIEPNGESSHIQIPYYTLSDHSEVSKRGVIELDGTLRLVKKFIEKPKPHETDSNYAVPPLYLYSRKTLDDLRTFVKETNVLAERDAPGMFVHWLNKKGKPIFVKPVAGRFDVGGLSDYIHACKYFEAKHANL